LTFNEYIKEYGLERTEGLLLRSLSDFYKTLSQTIPDEKKSDSLLEIEAHFRALIARVDASLVEEWESLAGGGRLPSAPSSVPVPVVPVAIDANPRAFALRVRAELHLLVKALAQADYDDAAGHVDGFDAAALKVSAEAFAKEKGHPILFTIDARNPTRTLIEPLPDAGSARSYRVRQVLVDEAGDDDWVIEGVVDASQPKKAGDAIVEVRSISR
jgi:hypothetical protein